MFIGIVCSGGTVKDAIERRGKEEIQFIKDIAEREFGK